MAPEFHPKFYLEDKPVVFLVQNFLFKFPRDILSHFSPIFRDMFSMVPEEGAVTEGDDPEHPIILPDDSAEDFEALVGYFRRDFGDFQSTKENWISILRLCHKYQMLVLEAIALRELSSFPFPNVFEKIALCETFGIPLTWAKDAVHKICTREESVRVDEGRELSRDWILAILWARQETIRKERLPQHSYYPGARPVVSHEDEIVQLAMTALLGMIITQDP